MKDGDEPLSLPLTNMRTLKNYRSDLQELFPGKRWTLDVDTDRMVVNVSVEVRKVNSKNERL